MTADSKGRDLFIVDNSVSGWTGLRYLEEWSGIAKAFDIATGYFEIGALLALDGRWQPLDKIRILMGAETTHRTRKALLDAVRARAVQILDGSLETNKDTNPFLHGVPAILEALRSGQIECRVYDKDKFHAKAYITHELIDHARPGGGPVRLSSHGLFSQNRRMGTPFTPSRKDVERYRRLRALSMDLNHRIIKTIPRRAYDEVGDAIGILSNGVLEFESADMTSVLMDCCLYDWFQSGKSVVQQYSETHPALPGTDEQHLLSAYVQAKYRVLVVQSAVAGAGLRCQDVLNNEDLFLMDLGLSQSAKGANAALATRTIPLGEYWMTTGAGLPINSKKAALDALGRIASGKQKSFEGPGSEALLIVRACLAAGAAGYVTYASAEAKPREPRRRRWRWS